MYLPGYDAWKTRLPEDDVAEPLDVDVTLTVPVVLPRVSECEGEMPCADMRLRATVACDDVVTWLVDDSGAQVPESALLNGPYEFISEARRQRDLAEEGAW